MKSVNKKFFKNILIFSLIIFLSFIFSSINIYWADASEPNTVVETTISDSIDETEKINCNDETTKGTKRNTEKNGDVEIGDHWPLPVRQKYWDYNYNNNNKYEAFTYGKIYKSGTFYKIITDELYTDVFRTKIEADFCEEIGIPDYYFYGTTQEEQQQYKDNMFRKVNIDKITTKKDVKIPAYIYIQGQDAFYRLPGYHYKAEYEVRKFPDQQLSVKKVNFADSKSKKVELPGTVEEITGYTKNDTEIIINQYNLNYSSLDGVLYDKNKTLLLSCYAEKTGDLTIPDSVTEISDTAFVNSKLSNIILNKNLIKTNFKYPINGNIIIPKEMTLDKNKFIPVKKWKKTKKEEMAGPTFNLKFTDDTTEITYDKVEKCMDSIYKISIGKNVSYFDPRLCDNGELWYFEAEEINGQNLRDFYLDPENPYYDFDRENGIVYNKDHTKLVKVLNNKKYNRTSFDVPNSVQEIGEYAFYKNIRLESVDIPSTVTKIGKHAFEDCTALKYINKTETADVNIPASVTSIAEGAFKNCTLLKSVSVAGSITTESKSAFENCTSLQSIDFSQNVTSLPDRLFYGCSSLEYVNASETADVNIPASVTSIGESAFENCTSIKSVNMVEPLTSIEKSAFENCTSLISISIPQSITSLVDRLFYGCSSLKYINRTGTVDVNVPAWVTSIGESVFENCTSIESVNIPQSITIIPNRLFYGCSSLEYVNASETADVNIPAWVTSIGESTFENCTSIENVNIPQNITIIPNRLFYGCNSLKYVNRTETADVNVPAWFTSIGESVFENCTSIENVNIPQNITIIPNRLFCGCSSLNYVNKSTESNTNISENVTSIGDYAFRGCPLTGDLILGQNVTFIGTGAFESGSFGTVIYPLKAYRANLWITNANYQKVYGAEKKEDNTIRINIFGTTTCPKSIWNLPVTSIKGWYWDDENAEIIIPNTIVEIEADAFYSREGIFSNIAWSAIEQFSITFEENSNLRTIGNEAFLMRTILGNVTLPSSLENIGNRAFAFCNITGDFTFSSSLKYIGDDAFSFCNISGNLIFPENCQLKTIGKRAFRRSTIIQINLPNRLTTIEDEAFDFTEISEITIPASVTTIGEGAFLSTSLKNVYFEGNSNLVRIGDAAFSRTQVRDVVIPESVLSIGSLAFVDTPLNTFTILNPDTKFEGPFYGNLVFQASNLDKTLTDVYLPKGFTYEEYYDIDKQKLIPTIPEETHIWSFEIVEVNGVKKAKILSINDKAIILPTQIGGYDVIVDDNFFNNNDLQIVYVLDEMNLENINIGTNTSIYQYSINNEDNTATITNIENVGHDIVVPIEINGYIVNPIDNSILSENIENIFLPYSMNFNITNVSDNIKIWRYALVSGYNTKVKLLGVENPLNFVDVNIPKKIGIYTLKQINDDAFKECVNLKSFSVEEGNEFFSTVNDVLFNYDKSQLIAYPLAKTETFLEIPPEIEYFDLMSLENGKYLKDIYIPEICKYPDILEGSAVSNIKIWKYSIDNNKAIIKGVENPLAFISAEVPPMICSFPVCSMDKNALVECKNLEMLYIPSFFNVESLSSKSDVTGAPFGLSNHRYNIINSTSTQDDLIDVELEAREKKINSNVSVKKKVLEETDYTKTYLSYVDVNENELEAGKEYFYFIDGKVGTAYEGARTIVNFIIEENYLGKVDPKSTKVLCPIKIGNRAIPYVDIYIDEGQTAPRVCAYDHAGMLVPSNLYVEKYQKKVNIDEDNIGIGSHELIVTGQSGTAFEGHSVTVRFKTEKVNDQNELSIISSTEDDLMDVELKLVPGQTAPNVVVKAKVGVREIDETKYEKRYQENINREDIELGREYYLTVMGQRGAYQNHYVTVRFKTEKVNGQNKLSIISSTEDDLIDVELELVQGQIAPKVIVKEKKENGGTKKLKETDYKNIYLKNIDVDERDIKIGKEYTLFVTGKEDFKDHNVMVFFKIDEEDGYNRLKILGSTTDELITVDLNMEVVDAGLAPNVIVKDKTSNKKLRETEYTKTYKNNAGEIINEDDIERENRYSVTIEGKGETYNGQNVIVSFEVEKRDNVDTLIYTYGCTKLIINESNSYTSDELIDVQLEITDSQIVPKITVRDRIDGSLLEYWENSPYYDTEYTKTYYQDGQQVAEEDIEIGKEYLLTIIGQGDTYGGHFATVPFKIELDDGLYMTTPYNKTLFKDVDLVIPSSIARLPVKAIGNGKDPVYTLGNFKSIKFEKDSNGNCNLKEIRDFAFNLTALKSIEIPSSVTTIGDTAFAASPYLETVTFEEESELETIGEGAFGLTPIKNVIIPASVEEIKDQAFAETPYLEKVIILNKDMQIGEDAFALSKTYWQEEGIILPGREVFIPKGLFNNEVMNEYNIINADRIFEYDVLTDQSGAPEGKVLVKVGYKKNGAASGVIIDSKTMGDPYIINSVYKPGINGGECGLINSNGNIIYKNEQIYPKGTGSTLELPPEVTYINLTNLENCENLKDIYMHQDCTHSEILEESSLKNVRIWKYSIDNNNRVIIEGIENPSAFDCAALPLTVAGYFVGSMNKDIFYGCENLERIYIPSHLDPNSSRVKSDITGTAFGVPKENYNKFKTNTIITEDDLITVELEITDKKIAPNILVKNIYTYEDLNDTDYTIEYKENGQSISEGNLEIGKEYTVTITGQGATYQNHSVTVKFELEEKERLKTLIYTYACTKLNIIDSSSDNLIDVQLRIIDSKIAPKITVRNKSNGSLLEYWENSPYYETEYTKTYYQDGVQVTEEEIEIGKEYLLIITGQGATYGDCIVRVTFEIDEEDDGVYMTQPHFDTLKDNGELVIPNAIANYPVVAIGNGEDPVYAISKLKSIKFEKDSNGNCNLREIRDLAFSMSNLERIEIPKSVTAIGKGAFFMASKLEFLTFEEGSNLSTIGEGAFFSVPIKNLTIPDSVTLIEDNAFSLDPYLEKVIILNKDTQLGVSAFNLDKSMLGTNAALFPEREVFIPEGLNYAETSEGHNTIDATHILRYELLEDQSEAPEGKILVKVRCIKSENGEVILHKDAMGDPFIIESVYKQDNEDISIGLVDLTFEENEQGKIIYNITGINESGVAISFTSNPIDEDNVLKSYTLATCEEPGEKVYEFDDSTYGTFTKKVIIPATGHSWGAPEYSFSDDYTSCTASSICENDSSHKKEKCVNTVENIILLPTCTEKGLNTYTTEDFEDGDFNSLTINVVTPIDKNAHVWENEVSYAFSEDYSTCTATVTCELNNEHKFSKKVDTIVETKKEATCMNKGIKVYKADFKDNLFGYFEEEVEIEPIDHNWEETEYIWSEDFLTCKAYRKCSVCDLEEQEQVNSDIQYIGPTCEEKGKKIYTANFINEEFENQTKEIEMEDMLEHSWGTPEYRFGDDGSCTAISYCSLNPSHEPKMEIISGEDVNVIQTPLTCNSLNISRSWEFTDPLFETQTKSEVLEYVDEVGNPIYIHDYHYYYETNNLSEITEENNLKTITNVTIKRKCAKCGEVDESFEKTGTLTIETIPAATCGEYETINRTFSYVDDDNSTVTITGETMGEKKQHSWNIEDVWTSENRENGNIIWTHTITKTCTECGTVETSIMVFVPDGYAYSSLNIAETTCILKYAYNEDDETVKITGTGHNEYLEKIEIPSRIGGNEAGSMLVTTIGNNAFKDCIMLGSVTIPKEITSIGTNAFENCQCLTEINVDVDNASYLSIDGVLYDKNQTTLIKCPEKKSGKIIIPSSVSEIGIGDFNDCDGLTDVFVKSSLDISSAGINDSANIWRYEVLESQGGTPEGKTWVNIDSVTKADGSVSEANEIACNAMGDNYVIRSVDANDVTLTHVCGITSNNTFDFTDENNITWTCTILQENNQNTNNVSIVPTDINAISGTIEIPSVVSVGCIGECAVTRIGNLAFYGCTSLTSITIPSSVTSIGRTVFRDCSNLKSVTFESPSQLSTIEKDAFHTCTSLTSITLPSSVTSIADGSVFNKSNALTEIIVDSNNSNYCSVDGVLYNRDKTELVRYPEGKSGTSFEIPSTVTKIGNWAFGNCKNLTSITITEGVASIGNSAFEGCRYLTSITIPSSVTSIGDNAFNNCSGLTDVFAKKDGVDLSSLNISNDVNVWRYEVLADQTGAPQGKTLVQITSHDQGSDTQLTCTAMGDNYVIRSVPNDISLTHDCGITNNNSFDFTDENGTTWTCTILQENNQNTNNVSIVLTDKNAIIQAVEIPSVVSNDCLGAFNVTTIGQEAFYDCSSLTSVVIPISVTSIGQAAFRGCSSLISVSIPEGVTTIERDTFMNCKLQSITIPNGVTTIGQGAFYGCISLTSITIPSSVTSIGDYAFADCSSLTSITLPSSVESIGGGAFSNCSSLADIYLPTSAILGNNAIPSGARIWRYTAEEGAINSRMIVDIVSEEGAAVPESFSIDCTAMGEDYAIKSIAVVGVTLNHVGQEIIVQKEKEATCTEIGYESGINICSECGLPMDSSEIMPVTEHTWSTEWSAGEGMHWHNCTVCHEAKSDEAEHTLVHENQITATSTENGHIEGYTCSVCGKHFSDETGIEEIPQNEWIMKHIASNYITITIDSDMLKYDGQTRVPAVEVKDGGRVLTEEIDYIISYKSSDNIIENPQNIGTYKIIVTGQKNYVGEKELEFEIYLPGDINKDGLVNIFDLQMLYNHLAEIQMLTNVQMIRADLNNDTEINLLDLQELSNKITTS